MSHEGEEEGGESGWDERVMTQTINHLAIVLECRGGGQIAGGCSPLGARPHRGGEGDIISLFRAYLRYIFLSLKV